MAMTAVPATTDNLTDFPLGLGGGDGCNLAYELMSWDTGQRNRHVLEARDFVTKICALVSSNGSERTDVCIPSADTASLDFEDDVTVLGLRPRNGEFLQLAHLLGEGIASEACNLSRHDDGCEVVEKPKNEVD